MAKHRVTIGRRPKKLAPDEVELTITLVGDPTAVVHAVVNGMPRAALEKLASEMQREISRTKVATARRSARA